jgi:hypothetical protein
MEPESQCSVGKFLRDECFKSTFIKDQKRFNLTCFKNLDTNTRRVISLRVDPRVGSYFKDIENVCGHHYAAYFKYYKGFKRAYKCVDPFKKHKKSVPGVRAITLDFHDSALERSDLFLIPGQTLCRHCHANIEKLKPKVIDIKGYESSSEEDILMLTTCEEQSPFKTPVKQFDRVNELLRPMNIEPVSSETIKKPLKRRLQYVNEVAEKARKTVKDELAAACHVDLQDDNLDLNLEDYSSLLLQLKEKCSKTSSFKKKVSILTLAPKSWTQRQVAEFFEVPLTTARKSIKLCEQKGILCELEPKKGRGITTEELDEIEELFNSDDYSRLMPGQKDFVLVSS